MAMKEGREMSDFDVFEVLDITHEVYYSRVLAWLLDPTGSHLQKKFFLKWFLKRCGISDRVKYESVTLEEEIRGAGDDPRRRVDIAVRCEGYLVYVEVKIDNRSIDKLQPFEQYKLGQRRAEDEKCKFVHVFLTPDETPLKLIGEAETRLIRWAEIRDTLRERVRVLQKKTQQQQIRTLHLC